MKHSEETKIRIMDAAEALFADRGLERVSIRDITDAAQVNLAAVNYHFGGKNELIAAVFERRVGPLNAARLAALEAVAQAANGKVPKVEKVIEALVRPALKCCAASANGSAFSTLFGRCLAEAKPELGELLRRQFAPVVERFENALMAALPGLSRSAVFWRLKFTFGALHHWLLTKERFLPPWAEGTDLETQVREFIAFTAAGFKGR